MNVVTYARVSTISQETEGQSLPNQERSFQQWLAREKAIRIAGYAESKSAKSIEGRSEFLRMIEDLPLLCPDLVVVDTIDRFSRNLKDGLDLLERFKGLGIRLLALDWEQPVDLDDDRDWKNVVQELTAADYERRRIRARCKKGFAARRARGATLHNSAPFGLIRDGDVLLPDERFRSILQRADRMCVAGKSFFSILHYVQEHAPNNAWITTAGLSHYFKNELFVSCGMRSRVTQGRINERLQQNHELYGHRKGYIHSMIGVFACGLCVGFGGSPEACLMCANCTAKAQKHGSRLICQRRHEQRIGVQEHIVEMLLLAILEALLSSPVDPITANLHSLQSSHEYVLYKHLEKLEAGQTNFRKQRIDALHQLESVRKPIVVKIRHLLENLNEKEAGLMQRRQRILLELLSISLARSSTSSSQLKQEIRNALNRWPSLDNTEKNHIAKAVCKAVGSHPLLYRNIGYPNEALATWRELLPTSLWRVRYGKLIGANLDVFSIAQQRTTDTLNDTDVLWNIECHASVPVRHRRSRRTYKIGS